MKGAKQMNYFKYYRLTTLMILNKRHLGYAFLFVIIYHYMTNKFFEGSNSWVMGPSLIFIVAVFMVSIYAHQMKFESNNPIYQFPLTIKQKTRYEYITVFVTYIAAQLFLVLIGLIFLGIFALLGDVSVTDGEEVTSSFWTDAYAVSHHLFIMALVMPLSYISSNKKKFIYGLIFAIIIFMMNAIIYLLATGNVSLSTSILLELTNISFYKPLVIGLLSLSMISVYVSYRKSVSINSYN
jgi:hypothetical protein